MPVVSAVNCLYMHTVWKNICVLIPATDHWRVSFVTAHFHTALVWVHTCAVTPTYCHTVVMSAVRCFDFRLDWEFTCLFIRENRNTTAAYAIRSLSIYVHWRFICVATLVSGHMPVMCAVIPSYMVVIWNDTWPLTCVTDGNDCNHQFPTCNQKLHQVSETRAPEAKWKRVLHCGKCVCEEVSPEKVGSLRRRGSLCQFWWSFSNWMPFGSNMRPIKLNVFVLYKGGVVYHP